MSYDLYMLKPEFSNPEIVETCKLEPVLYSDEIYGEIEIPDYAREIIQTNEFQRLKNIKQLGLNFLEFPEATHTRYEHSIGTCHLILELMKELKPQEENLTKLLAIAGLGHDIGHGPFSHTFDNNFLPACFPDLKWTHEQMSGNIVDYLIDKNHIQNLENGEDILIKNFILGKNSSEPDFDLNWAYDVVNNKRNSLDFDKMDYLQRDTSRLKIPGLEFQSHDLLKNAKIMDDQIGYDVSVKNQVESLFKLRFNMFKKYTYTINAKQPNY